MTGGAGFIGSNFIRRLLADQPGVQVVTLDKLTYAGSLENLRDLPGGDRHSFVHGDICDQELVEEILRRHDIDTLVHFAAESHVDRSIAGPSPFIQTNLVGTFNLLEAARLVWGAEKGFAGRHFHHVSTDEVYGELALEALPFSEFTPYAPRSPYSASKAGSDHLVRAYHHTYGMPVSISSCSNNYGPYQFPEKLIPHMILNALRDKPLPVYGDGHQVRDWLYVDDHCEAILRILDSGKVGETYNIGGGNQPSNLEVVRQICDMLDRRRPAGAPHERLITHVPDRRGHDRRYAMDITRIRSELGWSPRHALKDGLELTLEWYLSHLEWADVVSQQAGHTQRGEGA